MMVSYIVRTDYFPFQRPSFQEAMLLSGGVQSVIPGVEIPPDSCGSTKRFKKKQVPKNHFKEIKSEPFPNLYFHVGKRMLFTTQPPPTPKSCHTSADPIAINSSMQWKIIFAANILRLHGTKHPGCGWQRFIPGGEPVEYLIVFKGWCVRIFNNNKHNVMLQLTITSGKFHSTIEPQESVPCWCWPWKNPVNITGFFWSVKKINDPNQQITIGGLKA